MSDIKDTKNQPAKIRRGSHMHQMTMPVEKAKNFKGTFRRFIDYLKPFRKHIIFVLIASILSSGLSSFGPYILGLGITNLFETFKLKMAGVKDASVNYEYIFMIVSSVGLLYLFSAVFTYIQQRIMINVAQKTVYNMRKKVKEKLTKIPIKYFDENSHGDILSRVTNDIDNISQTLQQSLVQLTSSVITIIGSITLMIFISPILTLICIGVLVGSGFFTKIIVTRSRGYFSAQQETLGVLNGHAEEMLGGHIVVKAFAREKDVVNKFEELNEKLFDKSWKAQFISGIIMPLMTFMSNIGYILIIVVGSFFVSNGGLSIGNVQAFIQYSRSFMHPVAQLSSMANILQSTIASAERVFEILDVEEEVDGELYSENFEHKDLKGSIEFKEMSFSYNKEQKLIEDMNIEVKEGQTVAIVGPTGAGKTTLVNLLLRFYESNKGKILIDGYDIKKMTRENVRKMFGMVLQDAWLFNGTIMDNIKYGRLDASTEDAIEASRAAHVEHLIRTLPDGYNTVINEEGSNISQGEKQLITIARAILADPKILILDEATSSVDTRTEISIQRAMNTLMKGRTSFVIAHRISTIKDADLILVMDNGNIIEQGKHQELLSQNGFYKELYESQFAV